MKTLAEVRAMTPGQKREAIAKICGWKILVPLSIDEECACVSPDGESCEELPDYLHDLNAMHEAENWACREGKAEALRQTLEKVETYYWSATAEQRADAFLVVWPRGYRVRET